MLIKILHSRLVFSIDNDKIVRENLRKSELLRNVLITIRVLLSPSIQAIFLIFQSFVFHFQKEKNENSKVILGILTTRNYKR